MSAKTAAVNLDAEQRRAATAINGAFRVDACAGAGKTSTLIGRLRFLISQGIPERDIVALTFTRIAAEEMRLRSGIGKDTLRTLHSWALEAVKAEVDSFEPRLRPSVLLLHPHEILIPLSKQYSLQYKDLSGYISNAKRMGKSPQKMMAESDNDQQERYAKAYEQYQSACHRMGLMDFDSIIWELVMLFQRKPGACARHQVKYLMVDEAQDCSEMDWKLIRLITQEHNNVWIVGDFAQSVYGFRGASPHIFAAFEQNFPGAQTLPLGTNYRSQANVVDYSKQVMPEQTSYLNNWKAHKPATSQPEFFRFDNDVDEANWILNKVQAGQCAVNETAILARTNAQLAIMQGFCAEKQIPYKLLGKDNFWKRPEVLALFGLVRNTVGHDDDALKRVLKSPLPIVKFLRKDDAIAALESRQSTSLSNSSGNPVPLKNFLASPWTGDTRQDEILRGVHALIEKGKEFTKPHTLNATTPHLLMNHFATASGAIDLGEDDKDNETFIQDNIKKVVSIAKAFSNINDFIRFVQSAGRPSRKQTKLILSTVHGFKGQEAKNVFVIGVNLGVFPHDRAELQEEKRLYYVAVSRPTDNLFVSCSGCPSDFIKDKVPEEAGIVIPTDPWDEFQLQA